MCWQNFVTGADSDVSTACTGDIPGQGVGPDWFPHVHTVVFRASTDLETAAVVSVGGLQSPRRL